MKKLALLVLSLSLLGGCKAIKNTPGGQLLSGLFGGKQSQTQSELYPKFTAKQGDLIIRPDGYFIGVDVDKDSNVDVIYRYVPITDGNGEFVIDENGMRTRLDRVIYKDSNGEFSQYQQVAVSN